MVKIAFAPQLKFRLAIFSLLASFGAVIFGLYSFSRIAATVGESKVKVAEISRDVELLDNLMEERKLYAGEIRKVKSSLPAKYYEISYFITQLERLAQNNGLVMEISIGKEKNEEKGSYASITFSLDIVGKRSSVSDFLSQLSKLRYHTSVDKLMVDIDVAEPVTEVEFRLFVEK